MRQNVKYTIPIWEEVIQSEEHFEDTSKPKEKTVSVDMDWKVLIIVMLVVIIGLFLIGYNLNDTTVQDNILKIQTLQKDDRIQDSIIQKAQTKQLDNWIEENKSKEILKKYHIQYQ